MWPAKQYHRCIDINNKQSFQSSAENVTFYPPHKIEKPTVGDTTSFCTWSADTTFILGVRHKTLLTLNWTLQPEQKVPLHVHRAVFSGPSSWWVWVIYSTTRNQGIVVLSKLNITSLEIEETWYGTFSKKHLGNCFVQNIYKIGGMFCKIGDFFYKIRGEIFVK